MVRAVFHAGVGRVTITPPLSAPHAGWGAQTHVYADGVESDLWATVLLLGDGSQTVAIVDLDLVIVTRDESDAIREVISRLLNIPPENVRVSVTHNHAGAPPSSWNWMPEGTEALQRYYALLPSQVGGAALLASRSMRPARFGVAAGESHIAVNRRETAPDGRTVTGVNLDGPIDPHVLVARIDGTDGTPIAAIVGYTMHPTTMGPTNRMVSADWPGHLKRTVETLTGATCIFAQGATGDVGPGPEGYTDDVTVVRRIGAIVGCEAARVWMSIASPPVEYRHDFIWESGAPLGRWKAVPGNDGDPAIGVRSARANLPVRPQPALDDATREADEAVRQLHALIASGAPEDEIEQATFQVKRANMTLSRVRTFGGRETFPVELHGIRIGPLVLVGCEGEPFSGISASIKEQSPSPHTWFGGYTGGWLGYIPTPDEFSRGGYEIETSPYTEDAAGVLVEQALAFIHELAGAESKE